MATATKPRRPAGSGGKRNTAASKSAKAGSARSKTAKSARKPARRPAGSSRRSTRSRGPSVAARWRSAAGAQLGAHRLDVAAVALGVIGVLSGLGVFFAGAAGPFGDAVDSGVGAALGGGRYLFPFACFVAAVALLARRGDDETRTGIRVGLGVVLVLVAIVGVLHIARGRPTTESIEAIRAAGGVLGALAGGSIAAVAGVVGGVVVLGALGGIGVLLVADLRLHQVFTAIRAAARWVAMQARGLFEISRAALADDEEGDEDDDDEDESEDHVGVVAPRRRATALLFDQFATPSRDEAAADEPDVQGEPFEPDEPYEIVLADEESGDDVVEIGHDDVHAAHAGIDAGGAHATQLSLAMPPGARASEWKLPPLSLLKRGNGKQMDQRFVDMGGEVLESTMREFGVDARLVGASVGPTVTRYELELAPGVKVNKVTGLSKEIAYAMASHDVRILAPIPGRSAIGVEVPNKQRPLITLGDILTSDEAKKAKHPLEVAMGRDIAGRATLANLATFPHVLIAGQTGAGKSSCINSLVTSLLMRTTPDQVRLILVDPKRVELGQYNGVPHLLTEVVVNPKKAANALDWAVREMELRYDMLAEVGVRDITGYNAMFDRGDLPTADNPDPLGGRSYERLPFIVIVVDELADLMMVAARDVETSICRIAQMARAVGLHLVIATQRPSVDVITGVIKANIPSRLAFAVSSLSDSRVILDQPGAEKLVGKGDMLLLAASSSRTERIQGSWVDEECVRKIVAHWRRQSEAPLYIDGVQGGDETAGTGPGGMGGSDDDSDDLLFEAMELVVRSGLGSTSMLQRKLRVGFSRAGRIMDLLERKGIVGPSEGSKARAVLMTVDELEELLARS